MRNFLLFFLIIFILISCKSPPPAIEEHVIDNPVPVSTVVEEPPAPAIEIFEPVFEVISIVILQADLVVTKFATVLRVENPNVFAVNLSAITYELYGNGVFWANGAENNILHVPASSSNEVRFTFDMNFTSQNRRLLDDIIAMRQVNYRFKGQALVNLLIDGFPGFIADFDCTGLSDVRRN